MDAIASAIDVANRHRLKLHHSIRAPMPHVGPINSGVAGRTDHLPMHVPSGSYVLPADIVSAHGEGNTIAGFKVLRRVFGGVPYKGGSMPYGATGGPYGEPLGRAEGGPVDDTSKAREVAKNLGKNPDSIPDINETKKLMGFHKGLMSNVAERAQAAAQRGREYHESGKLPYTIGTRFHTPQSRAMNRPPHEVTGYSVDAKDPQKYGYYTKQGNPGDDYHTSGTMLVSNPNSKVPVNYAAHAASWTPLTGPRAMKASGGRTSTVPIVAAGGEMVLSPEQVMRVGGGDLDTGHRVLDEFVKRVRAKTIKTLTKLPGPAKG